MRIFKFGGESDKDANGVKNVVNVLKTVGYEDTLLVISAMGNTTNGMEVIINNYNNNKDALQTSIANVQKYHIDIMLDLFTDNQHPVFGKVDILFNEIQGFFERNKSPKYNFIYDQIVGYGELISTTIISEYFNEIGLINEWLDVRKFIKTDDNYRDGNVNWEKTQKSILEGVNRGKLNITQGFLGSDENNFTTTLGREGSDYTAAILAYCLNADSVTIWKDVPGVLNADPRYFEETQRLNQISYREAIELAFYGASVIHPKTLQPLQRKEIPLHVKSFLNPRDKGTTVGKGVGMEPKVPCFIVKKNQVLVKLSSLDFSFIVEDNISELFRLFHEYKMKVDLIQNSAISFSVCMENKFDRLPELLSELRRKFKVSHYEGVSLYTIRHFHTEALTSLQNGKEILLEQRGREPVQLVAK